MKAEFYKALLSLKDIRCCRLIFQQDQWVKLFCMLKVVLSFILYCIVKPFKKQSDNLASLRPTQSWQKKRCIIQQRTVPHQREQWHYGVWRTEAYFNFLKCTIQCQCTNEGNSFLIFICAQIGKTMKRWKSQNILPLPSYMKYGYGKWLHQNTVLSCVLGYHSGVNWALYTLSYSLSCQITAAAWVDSSQIP